MDLHVFQPLPIDVIEINPFKLIGKDWGLVTAGNKQKYNTENFLFSAQFCILCFFICYKIKM